MNVGIVGLGLIGGSLAKAIKAQTEHTVYGYNRTEGSLYAAELYQAVDDRLTEQTLPLCDLVIVCTPLEASIAYIKDHAEKFKAGALVVDCCGVKRAICARLHELAESSDFTFIGGHPMAGKAVGGFKASSASLFKGASMILTPYPETSIALREQARDFFLALGFKKVHFTTPDIHDAKIAFTSQLAHVISNAYAKSPSVAGCDDISAGSYRDMMRVSKFDAAMWVELFSENRDNLMGELDGLIGHLSAFQRALDENNTGLMRDLLQATEED